MLKHIQKSGWDCQRKHVILYNLFNITESPAIKIIMAISTLLICLSELELMTTIYNNGSVMYIILCSIYYCMLLHYVYCVCT